jgi:hypothetical protein
MPGTILVDREGRIAISYPGVVDPLVFEVDIDALLAQWVSVQVIFARRCEFALIHRPVFTDDFREWDFPVLDLSPGKRCQLNRRRQHHRVRNFDNARAGEPSVWLYSVNT